MSTQSAIHAPEQKSARGKSPGLLKRVPVALLMVAVVAGLGIAHLRLYPYALDDAHLHFRIAQHLAEYHVPYFTEDVKASSSSG